MKRFIALALSLCIVGGTIPSALEYAPIAAVTANAATVTDSGSCGENVTWKLDSEGTLTISGKGDMTDYGYGETLFDMNPSIKKIIIENGVTSIGADAFAYVYNLESVTIPSSVTSIGAGAFYACPSLTSIAIPDSVTSIGDYAFQFCSSLRSITLPASVVIGKYVFWDCDKLETISVDPDSKLYSSVNGILFNKNMTEIICYPSAKAGASYAIPGSVRSIGNGAFYMCKNLESVSIPSTVTTIGNSAFSRCENLRSVSIPGYVTNLNGAFSRCKSLESVTVPASVSTVDDYTFAYCESLKSVVIMNPDCSIGNSNTTIFNGYDENNKIYFDGVIYGYEGSTAQTYANKYGYTFKTLGELPQNKMGDINGDTYIDSSDAALILQHYAMYQADGTGFLNNIQLAAADYNSDSSIDSSDAALILKAYAENQAK